MSEPKFTPGPWRVCRSNEDFDGPLYTLDDDDYVRPINAIVSKSKTIACAHDLFVFDEANANLIAAAPELYEALVDMHRTQLNNNKHDPDDYENTEQCLRVKTALAKARGESHD